MAVVFRNPPASPSRRISQAGQGLGRAGKPDRRAGERGDRRPGESHGKAVVVGTAGEQEHGNAAKTTGFGNPFREGLRRRQGLAPSTTKRCGPGATVDVPSVTRDEIWVRSHYDTITVQIEDAPPRRDRADRGGCLAAAGSTPGSVARPRKRFE